MKYRRIIFNIFFFAQYNFLVMFDIWGRILWHFFELANQTNLRDKFKKKFSLNSLFNHKTIQKL